MIAYGATMTHLTMPDAYGIDRDVLLGWDNFTEYCAQPGGKHTYFGATIGRVANRIAGCSFDLENVTYNLSCNEKNYDTLHGGSLGYDRQVWTAVVQSSNSVTWSYTSPDGEMGFPGDLFVNVTHTITEYNEWVIGYSARVGNKTTILAMTNHAYFNLNANVANTETVMDHIVHFPSATKRLEVSGAPDYHLIPTGKILDIEKGSPWDFTEPVRLGSFIDQGDVTATGGFDNAWIFEPAPVNLSHVATIYTPLTGIQLDMMTDQLSVQAYTGNFLNGIDPEKRIPRKASQTYGSEPAYYQCRGAITLEAQGYPDAIHHENFPSMVMKAGAQYLQHTTYKFSTHPVQTV